MKVFVCNDGVTDDGEHYEGAFCVSNEAQRAQIHAELDDWLNHAKNITPEHEKDAKEREDHHSMMFSVMVCRTH